MILVPALILIVLFAALAISGWHFRRPHMRRVHFDNPTARHLRRVKDVCVLMGHAHHLPGGQEAGHNRCLRCHRKQNHLPVKAKP